MALLNVNESEINGNYQRYDSPISWQLPYHRIFQLVRQAWLFEPAARDQPF